MCKVFEQVACGFLEDQWAPSVCARDRAWVRSLRPKPEQWRRRGGEYSGEERGGVALRRRVKEVEEAVNFVPLRKFTC